MATEPILTAFDAGTLQRPRGLVRLGGWCDYWSLTKPEVNVLIVIATGIAFWIGCPTPSAHVPWALLFETVFGTLLVASGAAALNQSLERRFDAQMRRTASRPLAAGRIKPLPAFLFGTMMALAGGLYLAVAVRPAASLLALLTLAAYLFLYTPLKRRTAMCTFVGAFPGAMPVLIGYVAAGGKLDSRAWLLYAILFLWQFPHVMAIAWMYREDYERAGFKVLPPNGQAARFMAWQSVLPAAALVPVTTVPLLLRPVNLPVAVVTLLLSVSFLYLAGRLALVRTKPFARRLLLFSIAYLPIVFALQVLAES